MVTVKLDGKLIKKPYDITYEYYTITKSGRVTSGNMTMDLVSKKRKFILKYDVISSTALNAIQSVVYGAKLFFSMEYEEDGAMKVATVYAGEFRKNPVRTGKVWYYRDFEIHLIEV